MPSEMDAIWDAAAAASAYVIREDQIQKKRQQIRECTSRTCGNCFHWMKSSCVPEKKHGQFKSINSVACELFELSGLSARIAEGFEDELAELTNDSK